MKLQNVIRCAKVKSQGNLRFKAESACIMSPILFLFVVGGLLHAVLSGRREGNYEFL